MNKWLVGVGLVGVMLVIIGYFGPWIQWDVGIDAILGKVSLSGNQISHRLFLFGVPPLAWGLLAMLCIFGAVICPTGKTYTSTVTKIIGIIVVMCGVITLIALADAFSDLEALAGFATINYGYGFILSAVGGVLVLLAGIFGMFPIESSTKSQRLLS